jgi:hypothetical protein
VHIRILVLFWLGVFALPIAIQAQDQPTIPLDKFYVDRKKRLIRTLLRPLKFSVSTGFGSTYFKHQLEGMGIYQSPTLGPYVYAYPPTPPDPPNPTAGHSAWIDTDKPKTLITVAPGDFLVTSDTAKIGFKSKSFTVPLRASVHYELKQFRIGLGYAKDFIFIKPFEPISYASDIRNIDSVANSVSANKWYLMAGYSFYRIDKFLFTADAQYGFNKFGKNFDRNFIKASNFFNVGVTVERELSEFLRVFARPNFDFKSYTMALPESTTSIKHHANALTWTVGLTFSLPDPPKCYIKNCNSQINHAHGNKEYRSRMHPLWKKQNPGYGENDPKLIKYKWRNRKKINPY